jgi:Domain of unknown function (DUF4129)
MLVSRLMLRLLLSLLATIALASDESPMSMPEYAAALRTLQQTISDSHFGPDKATSLADAIPASYSLRADDQTYSVSLLPVKDSLTRFAKDREEESLDTVRRTVDLLLADAAAMQEPLIDTAPEHTKLAEILARSEFHNVAGETWWDRLKRLVQGFFLRLLGRAIDSEYFPVVGQVLLWALIIAAFLFLAYWLIRSLQQSGTYANLPGMPGAELERPWRDWRAEANIAAVEGRWRDAIHLSYWAGISYLEGEGLWRPDRARTPREYLRLLPSDDAHRSPLTELTRKFESVWYGTAEATEQSFATASVLLERLGCR